MSVTTQVRCSHCGTDFIDSRKTLHEGDEAICPKCGSFNALAGESERDSVEAASSATSENGGER